MTHSRVCRCWGTGPGWEWGGRRPSSERRRTCARVTRGICNGHNNARPWEHKVKAGNRQYYRVHVAAGGQAHVQARDGSVSRQCSRGRRGPQHSCPHSSAGGGHGAPRLRGRPGSQPKGARALHVAAGLQEEGVSQERYVLGLSCGG